MATFEGLPTTVPIEPKPRMLQILGHVNFEAWQCLAELIDNSIDAFLRDEDAGRQGGHRLIQISISSAAEVAAGEAEIVVRDNAGGMSLAEIQNAASAGYSGNDPIGKLGLFGMGFNVSTARLGRVAEILSHRAEDDRWVGLRVDVDELVRRRTWEAPVITRDLTETDSPSGTEIRIHRIPRDGVVRSMVYGRGRPALIKRLSRLYHVAMERYGVEIEVNGEPLPTWNLCLWGADRSVPSVLWDEVPAQMPVDVPLPTLPYCTNCWEWGVEGQTECLLCASELVLRERRIKGVLGIQRSFSIAWGEGELNHYGIDLIRNGRVIEAFDKDLFEWVDPADPARRERDYPVDATYLGGRIVGQLEIDFVPLRSYHKDSFEKSDPSWAEVRRAIRGEAPLRPDIARRYGYERPDSILARLFDGYRKTSPAGRRYLITAHPPGHAKKRSEPMHTSAELARWIQGFEAGNPDYDSDRVWWESVLWAEADDQPEPSDDDATVTSAFDDPESPGGGDEPRPVPADTEPDELVTVPDEFLSMTVNTAGLVQNAPQTITVRASRVTRGRLPNGYSVAIDPRGPEIGFTWDPRHEDFRLGLVQPADALIAELAFQVLYRAQVTQRDYPISYVQRALVQRAFPERDVDVDRSAQRATDLLTAMRSHLTEALPARGPLAVTLEPLERTELQRATANEGIPGTEVPRMLETGEFVGYMPLRFMPRSAFLFPDTLMAEDGFFAIDYAGYPTEELRAELRQGLYANLVDVLWLVEQRPNLGGQLTDLARLQLQKSLAALSLMELRRAG